MLCSFLLWMKSEYKEMGHHTGKMWMLHDFLLPLSCFNPITMNIILKHNYEIDINAENIEKHITQLDSFVES